MANRTTYLITGANRGIGLALASILLLRLNTTVIATIRSVSTPCEALLALPKAEGVKLITAYLSTDAQNTPAALSKVLVEEYKVDRVDVLILNAGTSSFTPLLETPPSLILSTFETNTLLPISTFQTLSPLLLPPPTTNPDPTPTPAKSHPKIIYITSYLGSITSIDDPTPSLAYGISKAAANFFIRKLHFEVEGVVSLAIHPGWVKTANGQTFADAVGVGEPPQEAGDVAGGILDQIDNATRETTSGSFVRWDGEVVPW